MDSAFLNEATHQTSTVANECVRRCFVKTCNVFISLNQFLVLKLLKGDFEVYLSYFSFVITALTPVIAVVHLWSWGSYSLLPG